MFENIKSFGLNVIPEHSKTAEYAAEKIANAINGLWEPLFNYIEKSDSVFSGEVENEIAKIQSITMRIGMTMDATVEKRNINFEI